MIQALWVLIVTLVIWNLLLRERIASLQASLDDADEVYDRMAEDDDN